MSKNDFHIPEGQTYLCGHSLGLMPKKAREWIEIELDRWKTLGVSGYFKGSPSWVEFQESLIPSLANLIGAKPDEVVPRATLTANLHDALTSFFKPNSKKYKIISEKGSFPSDRYALTSHLRMRGLDPEVALIEIPSTENGLWNHEAFKKIIDQEGGSIAVALLPALQYLSGEVFPVQELRKITAEKNILLGLDLAHAAGNIPLQLHEDEIDFAVFCTYKYLNAGPGATGGLFIHEKHHERLSRHEGWWGNDLPTRMLMSENFVPAKGVRAWQLSNIPIFSSAPLRASLELFERESIETLRKRSLQETDVFIKKLSDDKRYQVITSIESERRGNQVSFKINTSRDLSKKLFDQMTQSGFFGDWREPGLIRVSYCPLYNEPKDLQNLAHFLTTSAIN